MGRLVLACLLAAVPLAEAAAQIRSTELVCAWRERVRPGVSGTCRSFRAAGLLRIGRACSCSTAHGIRTGRIVQRRGPLGTHGAKPP